MGALVIGDIHGCYDELCDLLDAAGLTDDDQIIALGDMVDRGPQSAAVLRFFRDTPNASSIRGNHEHKHIRIRQSQVRAALSQQIARRDMGEAFHAEICEWMETLPFTRQLDDALLLHGFFEPGVPLADQNPTVLMGTLSGERHLQQSYPTPWYTLVGHPTPIIVGHRDYLQNGQPFVYRDRVFGLDTTVYAGRRLTGLLLPAFRLISVPARSDHWRRARADNADLRYQNTPLDRLTWEKARAVMAAYRRHPPRTTHHRQRQQRLAAMVHAADRIAEEWLTSMRQLIAANRHLSNTEFSQKIWEHPSQKLLLRWKQRGSFDRTALERYYRRPADLLRFPTMT